MSSIHPHNRKQQSGVTLLEALIAFLVLSVGLLGMAGLQLTGMTMTNDSYFRSQATWMAYDILDRMRANYDTANTTAAYKIDYSAAAPSGSDCAASTCTEAEMATYDLGEWKNELAAKLPDGNGEITFADTSSVRTYVIAIRWDDSRGESSPKELKIETGL